MTQQVAQEAGVGAGGSSGPELHGAHLMSVFGGS